MTRDRASARFAAAYGREPTLVIRAPGRVNLIGEHTDHQEGLVLPIAIDRALWLALEPMSDARVELVSEQADGTVTIDLDRVGERIDGWGVYLQGMAWALRDVLPLRGWRGAIDSDIPAGAGLSSSAAFELAVARAWAALAEPAHAWVRDERSEPGGRGSMWEPTTMARHAQRAENHWVGVASGIMDQLTCAMGRAGHALLIDCRTLDVAHVMMPGELAVVIMDTGTRRELTGSAYNERQIECQQAAAALGVASLRDATLEEVETQLDGRLRRRARHVVSENQRVLAAAGAMRASDPSTLGSLLTAGNASMRDDFAASGPALDTIVELAAQAPGCYGARLTGAGFAGCAIALVRQADVDAFCTEVGDGYQRETGTAAQLYVTTAADGASVCSSAR